MGSPIALYRSIARAVIDAVDGGMPVRESLIEVVPGIGRHVWNDWAGPDTEARRQSEIEAVALILDSEAPLLAAEIVAELGANQPEDVRQFITDYLTMVPAAARAALRRQSEPSGTFVPPDLVPRSANELVRFLPSRLPRFKPGDRPPGLNWELERLLGVGGNGEVWKAYHLYRREWPPVALKFCQDPSALPLLRNEVMILDRIMNATPKHPGIVRLLDTHLDAEPCCLIYEFVKSGDLTGLIRSWYRDGRSPNPVEVAELVRQIAEVIGSVHRFDPPIVHRDLKPANILVAQAADGSPQIRITDFGIGRLAARQSVQRSGIRYTPGELLTSIPRGSFTPLYASPQQSRGADPDPRDDVFALGMIWFQLTTGRLDRRRRRTRRWSAKLKKRGMSPELIDLLTSCLAHERTARPADAMALSQAIAALLVPPNFAAKATTLPAPDELKTATEYINRGVARYGRKEFAGAIADYDQAIRLDPEYALAYYDRGLVHHALKDYTAAIADYDQAIRLDPKYAASFINRGNSRRALSDLSGATADYDQAILLNPKYGLAYNNRGLVRHDLKDYAAAIADYNQAIGFDPNYALAHNNRGLARYELKDYAAAIADYNEAIRLDTKLALPFYNRGLAHAGRKDYISAIADYDQAICLDPSYVIAFLSRGNACRARGDLDGALIDYEQALRLNPNYAVAYHNRGLTLKDKGDLNAALADYDRAIRLDPNFEIAYRNRGFARQLKGDLDGALADFTEGARLAPQNAYSRQQIHALRWRKRLHGFWRALRG